MADKPIKYACKRYKLDNLLEASSDIENSDVLQMLVELATRYRLVHWNSKHHEVTHPVGDLWPEVDNEQLDRTNPPGSTCTAEPLTRKTFVHTFVAMEIQWDPKKAEANLREHGISFAEAATVLVDEYALSREDQDSIGEQRFVSLGMSGTGALLVVVYTHREPDIYRLISSWKANKPQRNQYEKGRR